METRFSDRSTILQEWKHNAYFSLNKKDYRDILARLKDGNAVLNTLATQNTELEPTRRSRSQLKLARIIRKLSKEVHAAFRSVLRCDCAHSLGLGMAAVCRKDIIPPGQDGQRAARAIPLDVILDSGEETQRWKSIKVQVAEEKVDSQKPSTADSMTVLPGSRSPKRVHWPSSLVIRTSSSTAEVTQTATQAQHSSYLLPSMRLGSETVSLVITDLCHTIQKGKYKSSTTTDSFGDISCNSRRFKLCHSDGQLDHLNAISLNTILNGQDCGEQLVTFNYVERLKLALSLSYSVLHLYRTPWLAKTVTPEDIVFLRKQQQSSADTAEHLGRPFLAKILCSTPQNVAQAQPTNEAGRPLDLTILSLGLLLIQIMVGRRISDLSLTADMRMRSTLSKKELASKYIASVMENGGMNYAAAVQWCLESILSVACLDDEKFAQDFYTAVILKLEADLGLQSLMAVSESDT